MNLKLMTLGSALAISAAMAQEAPAVAAPAAEQAPAAEAPAAAPATDTTAAQAPAAEATATDSTAAQAPAAEPAAEQAAAPAPAAEPAPAAAPAAEPAAEPAADQASADKFNVLHGNTYNSAGNEAGAATMSSNLAVPSRMFGSKLFYVEPTLQTGVVSFGTETSTYFLGFDNSQKLGLLTAGFANKSFGVSVNAALGKEFTSTDDNNDSETSKTQAGDDFGAKAGFNLGAYELGVSVDWLTTDEENNWENKGGEYDEDFYDIAANVNLSNSPSGKNWFWSLGLDFLRHNLTTTSGSDTESDPDSYTSFTPYFNIGGTILSVANARVLIGLNTNIPVAIYDKIDGVRDNEMEIALTTAPNALAELTLADHWIINAGVTHTWVLLDYQSDKPKNGDEKSTFEFVTSQTLVQAGVRFQYNNYALEASVANGFYDDPLCGFAGDGMIASIGGFIFF